MQKLTYKIPEMYTGQTQVLTVGGIFADLSGQKEAERGGECGVWSVECGV